MIDDAFFDFAPTRGIFVGLSPSSAFEDDVFFPFFVAAVDVDDDDDDDATLFLLWAAVAEDCLFAAFFTTTGAVDVCAMVALAKAMPPLLLSWVSHIFFPRKNDNRYPSTFPMLELKAKTNIILSPNVRSPIREATSPSRQ